MSDLPKKRKKSNKAPKDTGYYLVDFMDNCSEKVIKLSNEAYLLMALHANLSKYEVIGWLGGCTTDSVIYINRTYPVQEQETKVPTKNVEMDSISAFSVQQQVESDGMQVVGWYHSHPRFATIPSKIDIENHFAYQNGITQNFIAAIINPCLRGDIELDFFNINEELRNAVSYIPCRIVYELQEKSFDQEEVATRCQRLVEYYSNRKGRMTIGKRKHGIKQLTFSLRQILPNSTFVDDIAGNVLNTFNS